jgi:serine protease Do
VAELARQFVCVRVQSMNGQNLNLFQFDYDLTWMAFFMDGHDRFYARYGGRDDAHAESHLTKASLLRVMRQVLDRHAAGAVQTSRYEPVAKTVRTPEDIAPLKARVSRRKPGNRCIHCHDVKQGRLEERLQAGTFTRELIYSYPMPEQVGLDVDPDRQDRVRSVKPGSPAAAAGLRAGDVLRDVDGQHVLTAADLARVLELTPREASLPVEVVRDGRPVRTTLRLQGDWRKTPDPSWRSSTYVAGPNGGFWAEPLKPEQKQKAGIPEDWLALRVTVFFQGRTEAEKAGLQLGDVLVEVDGIRRPMTARQMHTHFQMNRNYGDEVPLVVRRGGKELKLTMTLPESPAKLD